MRLPELKILKKRKRKKIQAKRKKERAKNKKELAKKQKHKIMPRKVGRLDRASRYMSILYYTLGALLVLIMISFYLGGT